MKLANGWVSPASKGCPNRDYPISQLRFVRVSILSPADRERKEWHKAHKQIRFMHESQVDTFMRAQIQLHHLRGNPHHRDAEGNPIECKLDNLLEIEVAQLETQTVSYWWCSYSLQSDDWNGAKLNPEDLYRRLWAHPELIAQEKKDRVVEERAEYLAER